MTYRLKCDIIGLDKTNMSVSIRCGIKVNGVRKEANSHCIKPKYNKKGELIKGCTMWDECKEELSKTFDSSVEVFEDIPTEQEIKDGLFFLDINDEKKIWRKK